MRPKTKTIAVAGKGGTGKTTVAALLTRLLSQRGIVLAIDADPSSNLNLALGLPLPSTIGEMREDMARKVKGGRFDAGISKPDYVELKVHESLVESERVDLLVMGRPEGPGCYCAANNMLRSSIDRLSANYDYVVIDNEAGMEHISRQTSRDIDLLIITTDPSIRGVTTAARIKELIKELRASIGRVVLAVNRVDDGLSPEIDKTIREADLEVIARLPTDPRLLQLETRGAPLSELPPDSPIVVAVSAMAKRLDLT